jgi:UDP-galactopyranose mutase
LASKLVYTGKIDDFYDCRFGELQYRSLRFEHEVLNLENYQGVAQMNFTDSLTPHTRIIEHKHFECFGDEIYENPQTIITREYSTEHTDTNDAYYPVNDVKNNKLYEQYWHFAKQESDILFGGRLAEYRYYNMDEVIRNAISAYHNQYGI